MTDDELLAIYRATRQLAGDMETRDVELQKSTAALETVVAQVRQLPATLGQQTSKYIAAGIREVVQADFSQPIEKAVAGPVRSIEVAAYNAREAVPKFNGATRYLNWTWFAIVFALGLVLGGFGNYFFFTHEVGKLRDQIEAMQQQVAPPVVPTAVPALPPSDTRKKHGRH